MKKFVFFLTLVPLLCFGQNDNNYSPYTDYKFAISVDKLTSTTDRTSVPFSDGSEILSSAFRVELSKNFILMNFPTKVSLGYIANLKSSRSFSYNYIIGILDDGTIIEESNSGVFNINLISFPLTFSHSIYKSSSGKSNFSLFYGIIPRSCDILINYSIGSPYGHEGYPEFILDSTYGAEFQYLIHQNVSFGIKLESQSNNITQSQYYDINAITTIDRWEDLLGQHSEYYSTVARHFKRPMLLSFGISFYIR